MAVPTDLLVYRSVMYPQGRTFKYGMGGRLCGEVPGMVDRWYHLILPSLKVFILKLNPLFPR